LNVRYVLEGSVQRGGNRMRVNVQLIEAETCTTRSCWKSAKIRPNALNGLVEPHVGATWAEV
jgi:hypothetical protein